jgi:alpha-ketoglutarate-dependent taurine dioxygenase
VLPSPRNLRGTWEDKPRDHLVSLPGLAEHVKVDPIFLRDCCDCRQCVDSSTKQKLFDTADIPIDITAADVKTGEDGTLELSWNHDIPSYQGHRSKYTAEFVKQYLWPAAQLGRAAGRPNWQGWDNQSFRERNQAFHYDDYLSSDRVLYNFLGRLNEDGLAFIDGVPLDPDSIKHMAARIGALRHTFYGATWDVRSVPSAKNIAYTAQNLGFHMDLLYMADPPGIQILHCMEASASGGESLFSDAFRAVLELQERSPEMMEPMLNFPVTYRYRNDGRWYEYLRPTIEVLEPVVETSPGPSPTSMAINWSPPFQGPLHVRHPSTDGAEHESMLRKYMRAAATFKEYVERPDSVFETKMAAGTCVIFNNRRVVHARRAFDAEAGSRWLRGAYVDTDEFRNRLRVLSSRFGR